MKEHPTMISFSLLIVLVTMMVPVMDAQINIHPVTIEQKVISKTTAASNMICTKEMVDNISVRGMAKTQKGRLAGHCQLTRCPEEFWLETYYRDVVHNNDNSKNKPFVGISVGCNKGLDAVNTLRMGSNSERFSKEDWLDEMFDHKPSRSGLTKEEEGQIAGVCKQGRTPSFPLVESHSERPAIMHCIEPIPSTVAKLQLSIKTLGYGEIDNQKLIVAPYAMSDVNDKMLMPTGTEVGFESASLENCRNANLRNKNNCNDVIDVYTLDTYVSNHVFADGEKTAIDPAAEKNINILSIDVEGFDYLVLKGGLNTLKRTEYLEFEVHHKGPWREQSLRQAIDMLDDVGFNCYWAGSQGRLWRLNGENCFLDHYETKCWSNVACANRSLVPTLVDIMEEAFFNTLGMNKGGLSAESKN